MPASDLNLSVHNPMLIYSFLALYGVLTVVVLIYVRAKFRLATNTLTLLQSEWQNAESRHAGFVGAAQQQLSKLAEPASVPTLPVQKAAVSFNVRNQVVAMARRGIAPVEIGRSCGLYEGEVEVVLGMARLQK